MSDQCDIIEMDSNASDLLSILHEGAFAKMPEQAWSGQEFQQLFLISGTKSYVINKDQQPIGFILLRNLIDEAEIITFYILPDCCNNGYATLLLEWIIKKLRGQSFKRLFLEVRNNNNAAIRLYKKCSFEIIGRRKGYYNSHHGNKIDAFVMQRQLIV